MIEWPVFTTKGNLFLHLWNNKETNSLTKKRVTDHFIKKKVNLLTFTDHFPKERNVLTNCWLTGNYWLKGHLIPFYLSCNTLLTKIEVNIKIKDIKTGEFNKFLIECKKKKCYFVKKSVFPTFFKQYTLNFHGNSWYLIKSI